MRAKALRTYARAEENAGGGGTGVEGSGGGRRVWPARRERRCIIPYGVCAGCAYRLQWRCSWVVHALRNVGVHARVRPCAAAAAGTCPPSFCGKGKNGPVTSSEGLHGACFTPIKPLIPSSVSQPLFGLDSPGEKHGAAHGTGYTARYALLLGYSLHRCCHFCSLEARSAAPDSKTRSLRPCRAARKPPWLYPSLSSW